MRAALLHGAGPGKIAVMTSLPDPIGWYEARAGAPADSYEAIRPEQMHSWLEELHPPAPALVLDVGAGSSLAVFRNVPENKW